jgi:hypothetical protein
LYWIRAASSSDGHLSWTDVVQFEPFLNWVESSTSGFIFPLRYTLISGVKWKEWLHWYHIFQSMRSLSHLHVRCTCFLKYFINYFIISFNCFNIFFIKNKKILWISLLNNKYTKTHVDRGHRFNSLFTIIVDWRLWPDIKNACLPLIQGYFDIFTQAFIIIDLCEGIFIYALFLWTVK